MKPARYVIYSRLMMLVARFYQYESGLLVIWTQPSEPLVTRLRRLLTPFCTERRLDQGMRAGSIAAELRVH